MPHFWVIGVMTYYLCCIMSLQWPSIISTVNITSRLTFSPSNPLCCHLDMGHFLNLWMVRSLIKGIFSYSSLWWTLPFHFFSRSSYVFFIWWVIWLTWTSLSAFLLCSWFICFFGQPRFMTARILTCIYRNDEKSLLLSDFMFFYSLVLGWLESSLSAIREVPKCIRICRCLTSASYWMIVYDVLWFFNRISRSGIFSSEKKRIIRWTSITNCL